MSITPEVPEVYRRFIRAFAIFATYEHTADVAAEHDEMWAGPDPDDVSPEHLAELEELGWHPDDCTFHRNV